MTIAKDSRFTGLPSKALPTDDLLHGKSINIVMGILGDTVHCRETAGKRGGSMHAVPQFNLGRQNWTVIMADAASKGSTATRGYHSAVTVIMSARRA
jgi:hypothetical protein